jgi:hypothetical protein
MAKKKNKQKQKKAQGSSAAHKTSSTPAASAVATDGVGRRRSATVHYASLLNSVSAYQDYLSDHFEAHEELTRQYLDENAIEDEGFAMQALEGAHCRYNNLINDVYALAAKLMHSETTVSACLVKLLENRKEYLLLREANISRWLVAECVDGPTWIVPASECFLTHAQRNMSERSES